MQIFQEILELSQREKKGLTFYIGGQTVVGIVTQIVEDGSAVEVRNQSQSRIILRMERVDAVGMS